ncbi:6745_t:CDS:2 [Entrophospora sp. SA101]|nr:6745_t:CDS:2 [Entrophospora sp. SA101]
MPKEHVSIGKRAVVCADIELKGDVQIVLAETGPIIIGKDNIIEESVVIINKNSTPLIIGDENVFEVGCYVEGTKIGNKNIIEAKGKKTFVDLKEHIINAGNNDINKDQNNKDDNMQEPEFQQSKPQQESQQQFQQELELQQTSNEIINVNKRSSRSKEKQKNDNITHNFIL